MKRLLNVSAIASIVLLGACLVPAPSKAAPADTYQAACQPWRVGGYHFGEWAPERNAYHAGEDISCTNRTPLYAIGNGVVVYSALTSATYRWGNLVVIEHTAPNGGKVTSLYGHMANDRQVSVGQTVSRGQLIGYVGKSWTTENGNWAHHLHINVRFGAYVGTPGVYSPENNHGYEPANMLNFYINPSDFIRGGFAEYDSRPFEVSATAPMTFNEQKSVSFKVINRGSVTWQPDGQSATPARLGTVQGRDRNSAFYTANQGWASPNRVKLAAPTKTGEVGVFTATFSSNHQPNRYNECFNVLIEGSHWLPDQPICYGFDLLPPRFQAQWYNQFFTTTSNPTDVTNVTTADYLTPGQRVGVKALIKNVGELPWEVGGTNPVRLGSSAPFDRSSPFSTSNVGTIPASENWLSSGRPSGIDGRYDPQANAITAVTSGEQITTDQIAVFSFTATAPQNAGTWKEYFNPLVEGKQWMNDLAMWYPLRVLDSGFHYEYVGQDSPPAVSDGTSLVTANVRLRNTGRNSWPINGSVRLGTDRPMDSQSPFYTSSAPDPWVGQTRTSAVDRNTTVPGKSAVDPGEVAEFSMPLAVPTLPPGTYKLYLRPVADGVTWFGEDYGMYIPVIITKPAYDYQVLKQTFSGNNANFPTGSTMTASLAVKNTGRAVWQVGGANAVKLGTSRANDRLSPFHTNSGSDPWPGTTRASGIDGRVTDVNTLATVAATQINPGETALFRVPLTAPAPGNYQEYFNLLAEGITWLPDLGIYFPLTVTAGSNP